VSLSFEHGKIHALLGRNGAGKSTLLGLIANRLVPTSGRIFVDGEPAADNARALAKLYCMNDKKMYPENLRLDNLFKEMGRFYEGFDRTAAAGFAEAFGLDLRKKIGSLSTGYRSIYQLLDEPVLGLDANHRELFYKLLLDDYLEKQRTVIIATHLIEEVANLVEQVTIVDRGRVLLASSAEELRASGYSVSGRTADVAAYCAGMEVLDVEELGGLSVAYVQGKPDAARLNERLDVAPLNLQKLFVKLTEKEEAR
ncbi:MAG: ATP-binding cassette domain-containing protein, partial [Eggerthella lenta]